MFVLQCFLVLALAGVALAYPAADQPDPYRAPEPYAAPKPYAPPPKSYAPKPGYKEPEYVPQPYQFEYGVADQYTGTAYKAAETQDEKGTVLGEYSVNLPDGRIQTVTYRADAYGGFVADVRYPNLIVFCVFMYLMLMLISFLGMRVRPSTPLSPQRATATATRSW